MPRCLDQWRPDSRRLATGRADGAITMWPTDTEGAIAALCHTLRTDFANYAAEQPAACRSGSAR